ncbi:MAG: hypothetical protein J0I77_18040 [Rudaea sp.]|uniref:hypothetical protein n=1 Tax=unclassified Rudaea TaxID=2627037 RepID=UPI0010F9F285|nr:MULTISPECIES: hypothetical protein [unclassified Rudaea]MBN8887631.1 hypothetical protein [Rudaea sp.]MBR0346651.1 hypothetical protein [Rudaea sp.]
MHMHLLRTVYPHPEVEAIEPEAPSAANDASYEATRLTSVTALPASTQDKPKYASAEDEYYLGGYAGI